MHRYDPARQRLALGLATLAGLVDASGFVVAGGYFTSFMSGNTTRMGVELAHSPALALVPLGLIGAFLVGVTGGALVARKTGERRKRVLLGSIALLLTSGAGALSAELAVAFLGLAAMAMGLANNVFVRDGEVTVGVTYMTGALVRFGQGIAARFSGEPLQSTRGYGALWLALAAGAAAGGALAWRSAVLASAVAAVLALLLSMLSLRIESSPREPCSP